MVALARPCRLLVDNVAWPYMLLRRLPFCVVGNGGEDDERLTVEVCHRRRLLDRRGSLDRLVDEATELVGVWMSRRAPRLGSVAGGCRMGLGEQASDSEVGDRGNQAETRPRTFEDSVWVVPVREPGGHGQHRQGTSTPLRRAREPHPRCFWRATPPPGAPSF
jgi:hypothetical protein